MNSKSIARIALSATLLTLAIPGVSLAQGRLGVNFQPKLIPIVKDVYAYEGPLHLAGEQEIVRTNSLVVVTEEGVLVADGQDNPEEGRKMIAEIRKVTDKPIRYLVNASPHGDHVNSNEVFTGTTIIAHANAREAIRAARERATGNAPRPTLPHVTFTDQMTITLGGKTIELHYYGLGHTRGDTVVYLPAEKVAFMTELYFNGVFASVSEGFARPHLETLGKAMKLNADWFIPGHGHIDKQTPAMLKAGMQKYYDNVKRIHDVVQRHVDRGDTLDKTLAEADVELGEFAKLPFYNYLKKSCLTGTYTALTKK